MTILSESTRLTLPDRKTVLQTKVRERNERLTRQVDMECLCCSGVDACFVLQRDRASFRRCFSFGFLSLESPLAQATEYGTGSALLLDRLPHSDHRQAQAIGQWHIDSLHLRVSARRIHGHAG